MVAVSTLMVADLVDDGVLHVVHENHYFVHVTEDLHPGFRSGRRCTKCRQWAMGEHIGGKADDVCPKSRYRLQTEWIDGTGP